MEEEVGLHLSSADRLLAPKRVVERGHDHKGGTRCPECHRRIPKPRTDRSPSEIARFQANGPRDRVESLREGYDNLMEYVGADPESYPMLVLLELSLATMAGEREALKRYFAEGYARRP